MDPITIGALISGGSSLLGGLFGQSSQEKINQQNLAQAMFMAQNSIQMKVQDANKAGINPLAALGVQTSSPGVAVGSNALGEGISKAGQDISRAVSAHVSDEDKTLVRKEALLKLQNQELQNALLASQIKKQNAPGNPPAIHKADMISGQGQTGVGTSELVKPEPQKVTPTNVTGHMPGINPEVKIGRDPDGRLVSGPARQGVEGADIVGPLQWHFRNTVVPWFGSNFSGERLHPPGLRAARPGYHWAKNLSGGWSLVRDSGGGLGGAAWRASRRPWFSYGW